MKPTKKQIIQLLDAWIRQRPGLEYGNYGDPVAYRAEIRSIGKDLQHARTLLRAVELSSITAEELAEAFRHAYSGRLSLVEHKGRPALDYCTGQYWPTEYRRAACAVLASALWDHYRDDYAMTAKRKGYVVTCYDDNGRKVRATSKTFPDYSSAWDYARTIATSRKPDVYCDGESDGDAIRRNFRREFGRGIADCWFN